MARSDAIVLGAGIVGVSVALHLVKRGLAVTLIDRSEPGRGGEGAGDGGLGPPVNAMDASDARVLGPGLAPVFRHAIFWGAAASVTTPPAPTRAFAARFAAPGGVTATGDARSLRRLGTRW